MTATIVTSRSLGAARLGVGRAGYREALSFEWTKFRTTRSTVLTSVALAVSFPLLALVVAVTESLQPDDTILGATVLGGAVLAQITAAALGALVITNEFHTGMIRTTLTACPRRLVVLAAKATVVAAVVFAVALPSAVAAFGIGRAMLDGDTYATGDPFPALAGVVLAITAVGVLGVGIGTVVRRSAGAMAAVVGVVLLPGFVAPLLGGTERWVGGASLDGVLQKMTQSSDATPETVGSLGAWPSLAVVAGYTVVTVAGAVWVLRSRDT
jgi:ABC-type transport system involved in multi-copper enzyme maturation permease subunit